MTVFKSSYGHDFPLLSIVTPAYNQARFLPETIESVLAQDYPNIEYIVIDDGSTDETPAVLEHYAKQVRCERQVNIGQAATLNKGWRISKGHVLGYLSSDDRLRSGALSLLMEKLLNEENTGVVYGDYRLINHLGETIKDVPTPPYDARALQTDLVCQPGPGAIFLRSIYDTVGGWDETLRQVPDFDFWLRASRVTSFCRVPSLVADCRVHEQSASFRKISNARSDEIVDVIDKFWINVEPTFALSARRSRAKALITSARNHFSSGRVFLGFVRTIKAIHRHPPLILEETTWRMVARGLLRRFLYRLFARVG
jgi:glycosyltransferase involved in cell wall biosynthesis